MIRSTTLFFALFVSACTTAQGSVADHSEAIAPVASVPHAHSSEPATWDGLNRDELTRVDVRGTASSIKLTLQDIERLTPEQRKAVVESYRELSVNCPYTRASMMLPLALHKVVMGIDAYEMDPLVQRDWVNLQRGLTTHVAVINALNTDLAAPESGDYLHGIDPTLLVDRSTLLASPNPIATTMPLIEEITPLVERLDGFTSEHIDQNRQVVDKVIGQATMGLHIGGWENALRKVLPFVTNPEDRAQVQDMIDATRRWGSQGC